MFLIELDACPLDGPGGRAYGWSVLYRDVHTREEKVFKWGRALSQEKALMDAQFTYNILTMKPDDLGTFTGDNSPALDVLKELCVRLHTSVDEWLEAEKRADGIDAKAEARLQAEALINQVATLEKLFPGLCRCYLSPDAMV